MTNNTGAAANLQTWLEENELGQYHAAMVEQDITLENIADLDDADLRELGVSMGHRKTMRRAIDALLAAEQQEEATEQGQRRQLTVLFCDIVGSTQIARSYDAEDMAAILKKYHARCLEIIQKWGGRPLGTQGDGVIACFGLPFAQENDAERCVRAALEMSVAIQALQFDDGLALHSRIGISTGRMFVRGNPEETGNVVGDTLNLASRLQDSAAIDSVVLSTTTKRLVEKVARLTSLGKHEMKGFSEPVEIWAASSMIEMAERVESAAKAAGQPLIGRASELETLRALWQDAKAGKGRVAVISGDAGIGKSYVLEAVRQFVEADDHIHIRYFSAPFYENSRLFPIIAQLTHAAGLRDTDTTPAKLKKLHALFEAASPKDVPLIADLLSIDTGDAYPPLDMTPAEQKQATFGLLQSQLTQHASDKPVLILAEDAHWADPTSLEFLTTLITQSVPGNRILLVVTHRPPLDIGWGAIDGVEHLNLDRLSTAQSREIIDNVMGQETCPVEVVHQIIDNADGVPLFVEELARSALEQIQEDGPREVTLPSSLEDSLRGRLDRLSVGKNIVQTAAVFGRRFYMSLLRPMLEMEEQRLAPALQEPIDANIIFEESGRTDESMLFRHALIQQAAYQGLLRAQRKELHGRIADLLLKHRPGMAETEPETLARHFAGSGQNAEAIQYLTLAGQRAASRAGQIEATNHYQGALDLLKDLPPSKERDTQEVLLQALLGAALMATRGFAAPDVYSAFARAKELCVKLGDSPMYCSCLYGLVIVAMSRSDKAQTIALNEEMLATFGDCPVPSWAIAAHFVAGNTAFYQGDYDTAEVHYKKAMSQYTDDQHAPLIEQFGDNLADYTLCYLQWIGMLRGQIDASGQYLEQASEMADRMNNKNAIARVVSFRMGRARDLEDFETVADISKDVIDISMRQGYPYFAALGQIGAAWAHSSAVAETRANEDTSAAIAQIQGGLDFYELIGQNTPQPYWRTYLIEALIHAGRRDDALAAVEHALAMSERGLDSFGTAALMRLKGLVLMMAPSEPEAAEKIFKASRALALSQGAHLHVLHTTFNLAELLHAQGRGAEVRRDLASAIAAIETSVPFKRLTQAEALLAQIEG